MEWLERHLSRIDTVRSDTKDYYVGDGHFLTQIPPPNAKNSEMKRSCQKLDFDAQLL